MENVLEKMGFDNYVVETEENEERIAVNIIGSGKGNVIGYHGETLDALQYLASLIINNKEGYRRVVVDSEGYRSKREESLNKLARSLEQKVRRSGKAFKLEPMNPYERRIIHSALAGREDVKTISEGDEPARYVVIIPNNLKPYERRQRGDRRFSSDRGERSSFRGERRFSSDRRGGRDRGERSSAPRSPRPAKAKREIRFGTFLGNSGAGKSEQTQTAAPESEE